MMDLLRARSLLVATLVGMLSAFAMWSLTWALESHNESTLGLTSEVTTMHIRRPSGGEIGQNLLDDLNRELAVANAAAVLETPGDAIPGAAVIDPMGVLSWFPISKDGSVSIFAGTYCARAYLETGSCALVPQGREISGIIDAPPGVDYYQYAAVPLASSRIMSGRFVLVGTDPGVGFSVAEVFQRYGFEVGSPGRSSLWLELVTNPLLVVAVVLLSAGIIYATVFWRIHISRRSRGLTVRRLVGATRRRLLCDELVRQSTAILLGTIAGAAATIPLIQLISHAALPVQAILPVALGAVASILLLMAAYGVVVALHLVRECA